ncbi:hypothetical protein DIPPA_18717 [Diplonema papillatum]|nr:hypothetical protein DIPPA_18717 [Diplonema papillatum]
MRWWRLGVLGVLSAGVRADDVLAKPVQRAPWVRARVPSLPVSKVVLAHVKSYALLILPPANKGKP